jgi:hypothetical protein
MAKFWKPSGIDQAASGTVRDAGGEVSGLVNNRHKHMPLNQQRQLLPIFAYKSQILYALEKYRTIVLIGGTVCFWCSYCCCSLRL